MPGGEGSVEIAYELYGDRLVIEVNDDGEGFDPAENGDLGDLENLTEGGLGIAIIRSIADEFGSPAARTGAAPVSASPSCCPSKCSNS